MHTAQQINEAFDRISAIAIDNGEGMLETLQYMDRNLFQFSADDRNAFRIVFAEFQKLFAPVE